MNPSPSSEKSATSVRRIGHQRAKVHVRPHVHFSTKIRRAAQGGRADFSLPVGQFGAVVDDADDASFGRSYARISLMERHSDMLV